jgi:hypothetical protein
MNAERPPDGDGPGPAPRISMAAGETSGGQERWFTRAAHHLHASATRHSVSCGHSGFVPDDCLEQPESPGTDTTATAAALCTLGVWERADGGYRILDRELAGYALDAVCQRRTGEDPEALTGKHDHETKAWAFLARPVIITPRCAICGIDSTRVETVAPGQVLARWDKLPRIIQDGIIQARRPGMWHLIAIGPADGSLYGVPIDAARAGQIAWALRPPLRFAQVHQAGLHDDAGFCDRCDAAYCYYHWNAIDSGYGWCPRGHGKSLDPNW